MKSATISMSEAELKKLEGQLQEHAAEEGISIDYEGNFEKGKITGRHPIKWNVDFEFEPDLLTITAGGLFAGKVIENVEEKLATALAAIRRAA